MGKKRYRIVYCTPSLYMAGGVERVLTLKANYFTEHLGHDVIIIITDGGGKPFFFPLSDKVKVINLNINFDEIWHRSLFTKVVLYFHKQQLFRKRLSTELTSIRPDVTISTLRREINFITSIKDGSKKIGEIHINKSHFRNFSPDKSSFIKRIFSKIWINDVVGKIKKLDRFVVLTEYDRIDWKEIPYVDVIPNPLSFYPVESSNLHSKRVIAIGRYLDDKGYDLLLRAWSIVEKLCVDCELDIYGDGDKSFYVDLTKELHLDRNRCRLHGRVSDVMSEYMRSTLFICSSRYEGFCMGIIEAMACGIPVVSFDCEWGPRSIIRNGEDGLLVDNGDFDQMAHAIVALLNSPKRLLEMGRKAKENVRRFEIGKIAEMWANLFDELMA